MKWAAAVTILAAAVKPIDWIGFERYFNRRAFHNWILALIGPRFKSKLVELDLAVIDFLYIWTERSEVAAANKVELWYRRGQF